MSVEEAGGVPAADLAGFLAQLRLQGSSSYTLRSYRLGLQDFSRWLAELARPLDEVTRRDVEDYISVFASTPGRTPKSSGVIELATRTARPGGGRAERTINHRLSVLASFFAHLVARDAEAGQGAWFGRVSPVPEAGRAGPRHGRPGGGDAPRRRRGELRRREPKLLPRDLDPVVVGRLIDAATSRRDRALLILLARSGQRIGDWSEEHGRHGVLGLALDDLDRRSSTIVVRLKGARDEHRVPVTRDFWAAFDDYVAHERGDPPTGAAWVGLRRGAGRPLSYSAFEASLRHIGKKAGVRATAHMFRHTVANQMVRTAGVPATQKLLGHRHVETTIETYTRTDTDELVAAVAELERQARSTAQRAASGSKEKYVFHYDPLTIEELDAIATPRLVEEPER